MNAKRLIPIQRLAQKREDDQARQLADQQKALDTQEQRLEELRRYAAEYSALPSTTTLTPALLSNRRAFVEKLDTAVQQQSKQVERARGTCDVERARLLLASREVSVLDKLAASYQAQEKKTAEQRSQKELDDHAGRQFGRNKGQ
ncbi:MAG TPA: flagellar export protein FliJ [Rudaea sp.]|nr:flagellar export protein FliJ [Rudaea sp.]